MTQPTDVTVITASIYDRIGLLAENIASVANQTVRPSAHVIDQHEAECYGPIEAYNRLARLVDTEWLAILDDDNVWLPNHLETVLPALDSADIVYSWDIGGTRPRIDCTDWPQSRLVEHLQGANFIDQSCAIRLSVYRDVGGFRDPGHEFMDWDLWQRLARSGARFACVPIDTWCYRVGPWNAPGQPEQWTTVVV